MVFSCSSSAVICLRSASLSAAICSRVRTPGCCTMVGSMLPAHTGLTGPQPPQPLNGPQCVCRRQPTLTAQVCRQANVKPPAIEHCWNVQSVQPWVTPPAIEHCWKVQSVQRVTPPAIEHCWNVQSVQPWVRPPPMEHFRTVQSVQPPVTPPAMEHCWKVQSVHRVVPQMENCTTVQSEQPPPPPPISGGFMVSGITLMPRSLI